MADGKCEEHSRVESDRIRSEGGVLKDRRMKSPIDDRWESGMQQSQTEKRLERCLVCGIDVVIVNGKCTEDCTLEDCALSGIDDTSEEEQSDDRS